MKIAVGTPRCGPPSWHYHDNMMDWAIRTSKAHPEIDLAFLRLARALPIDVARNLLVELFLKTDAGHLWFVDQDAAFLPGTLDRLLSRRLPIVGALEMMRLPGCCYPMALKGEKTEGGYVVQAPAVYSWIAQHMDATTNEPQMLDAAPLDSLLEVGFTGCHCLLIRRDVLEAMESPWFQGYNPGGEDQYFCEKAFALGIPTYVDMSVLVGHAATDRIIGAFDFMAGHRFLSEKKYLTEADDLATLKRWTDAQGA